MKKYLTQMRWALLFFTIGIYSQNDQDINENIKITLNKFRSDYIESFEKENPEILFKYYSENIRIMPELQKTIFGNTNVLSYHKAFQKRFQINSYKREQLEIIDMGSEILEIGKFSFEMKLKETNDKHEITGSYFNLWEKSENNLQLITEAWNYDHYYGDIHKHLKFENIPSVVIAFEPRVPVNNAISFELSAYCKMLDIAVTQHDANIWSQFFATDAMLIPNYYSPYKGKKAIDTYIEMHVKELPVFEELDIRNDHIDDLGDYVIEYASHVANWRTGEYSGVNTGKNIRIWRREPNCSLKIFRSISMYD